MFLRIDCTGARSIDSSKLRVANRQRIMSRVMHEHPLRRIRDEPEKISNQDSDAIYPYRSVTGLYEIDTKRSSKW